jgi:PAS domain S-box-containing protein
MQFPKNIPCQAIMDSLADGVFTVDTDWTVTYFNRAAGEIIGIAPQEAVGRKCWDVFHSSLCDGACALRECIGTGSPLFDTSIFIVRPDGEKIPVSISAAPLRDARGRIVGGVETFRDISEIQRMRNELQGIATLDDIVTKSRRMGRILDMLPKIAASGSTVLILGESGTGKELFARAIHNQSPRREGPFVAVNCGAIPGELLESELFGHAKGAFTDAKAARKGRFARAAGGTIFLDEIGDLPLASRSRCCACFRTGATSPWARTSPGRPTPGGWRPPTGTWRPWWPTGPSAGTCSTVWAWSGWSCRRFASAPRTSPF